MLFLKWGIKPNSLTFTWSVLAALSTVLLWFGDYTLNIVFLLAFILFYSFDYVDGDMARILKKCCPEFKQNVFASWIDKAYYYFHRTLVVIGLAMGAYHSSANQIYFYCALITTFFILGDIMMKLRKIEVLVSKKKLPAIEEGIEEKRKKSSFVGSVMVPFLRPEPFSILIPALLLNLGNYLVIFYMVLFGGLFFKTQIDIEKELVKIFRD